MEKLTKECGPFNLFTDPTGVYPKENEMSERELFEAWADEKTSLPPLNRLDAPEDDVYQYENVEWAWQAWQAAREQQAKEFAECQARVVVLKQLLNSAGVALNAWHIKYGEFQPDWLPPAGQVKLIEEITEAIASTDTAAQTLREKHFEECADLLKFQSCCCAKTIRAAKERP